VRTRTQCLQLRAHSWHVGEPHLSHYSAWFLGRADGMPNTDGAYDDFPFHWSIMPPAEQPNNAASCFKVPP